MDPLDLAIEDAIRIHRFAGCALEPVGKVRFGLTLGFAKLVSQSFVAYQRLQFAQLAKIGHPALADGFGDRLRKRRVRHQQPAARRDAVGFVAETLKIQFGQILDRYRAQQPRMNRGDTVGAVRADDGEIGHTDVLAGTLLNETYPLDSSLITWKSFPDFVQQPAINLKNDFQVTR